MTAPSTEQTLRLVRWLPATPEAVFAAWTNADSLQTWMCPDPVHKTTAELDVRVGGCFRIVMCHGEHETVHTGVYREIQPPERLVFTWVSTTIRHHTTLVTVELRPLDEGTELILTHEGFPDVDAATQHDNGWQSIAAKLETYLYQGA
ncbi:SRPBCC family protein [Candidatus Entotheonella palauensis]|uniref:Activator of Hsp90 ATPase homologue 1/2-like C-terminal domain-containing protein n=1 Tax=Candidatus Entotheonella gemina TaxID=1429439 RepID=W4M540_9BACT|nr:SRPBCC domain-containing protein [Candidatus Entotheonella palauensis]ETX05305.1 MAG: hypothetical protein ETSY2_23800 [Candidatus Entotheonella gemina]